MGTEEICLGCMAEKGGAKVCPTCGYEEGTPPASPLHLKPGTVLNRKYLIGRVLGHGGFGITYLGLDLNLRVKLAIKEYFPTGLVTRDATAETVSVFSGDSRESFDYGLEKFLEEGRTLAKFSNVPEIVGVRDFLRENGTAYLVMDYIEGITLKEYLARQGGKLPLDAALTFVMPVVHALEKVHGAGMLHRDVSPDNIFVTSDFHVKLLDFGAARCAVGGQSRSLSVMLKPGYSPEEQYRSRGKQGPWTDVYATAATLYKLLTGETPPEAMDRLAEDDLKPFSSFGLSLPENYEKAILKALSVRAEGRYQSMAEFEAALTGEVEQEDTRPSPAEKADETAPVNPAPTKNAESKEERPVPPNGLPCVTVPIPERKWGGTLGEEKAGFAAEESPAGYDQLTSGDQGDGNYFSLSQVWLISGAVVLGIIVMIMILSGVIEQRHDDISVQAGASSSAALESSSEAQSNTVPVQTRSSGETVVSSVAAPSSSGTPSSVPPVSSAQSSAPSSPSQTGTTGNTSGNISNNGFVAQQGDWIYYSNESDTERLYKMKDDGSEKSRMYIAASDNINIIGNWIYYSNEAVGKLCKMKTDGTGWAQLSDDRPGSMNIVGDWIYYSSNKNQGLYKIKTDGSNKTKLDDGFIMQVNVSGDEIYYRNADKNDILYKIKTDGSGKAQVGADSTWSFNVVNDWIYYENKNDGDKLYKIKADGSSRTKLTDDASSYLNATENWVYYGNDSDGGSLYKVKTDGSGRIKLGKDKIGQINVIGDWIYYINSGDNYAVYRIKSDGTHRQLVN